MTIPMTIPFCHTETMKARYAGTWNQVFDHIARNGLVCHRPELDQWVRGLLLRPTHAQPALLLAGPLCGGKTTLRMAMGLLLPKKAIIQFPPTCSKPKWQEMLQSAWVVNFQQHPSRVSAMLQRDHLVDGRVLKWILDHNNQVDPIPGVFRLDVPTLRTTIPRYDLLRRLESEEGTVYPDASGGMFRLYRGSARQP